MMCAFLSQFTPRSSEVLLCWAVYAVFCPFGSWLSMLCSHMQVITQFKQQVSELQRQNQDLEARITEQATEMKGQREWHPIVQCKVLTDSPSWIFKPIINISVLSMSSFRQRTIKAKAHANYLLDIKRWKIFLSIDMDFPFPVLEGQNLTKFADFPA